MLWAKAHKGSVPDLDLAKQACAIAAQAAPFCHARLAAIEAKVGTFGQVEVKLTRQELAEQARREIAEAFREYQPPGHEEERANGPAIEYRSSPTQDSDRSEPAAEADRPALPRRKPGAGCADAAILLVAGWGLRMPFAEADGTATIALSWSREHLNRQTPHP